MGRVARYKKVKAFDKLTKNSKHSGRADEEYIWGTNDGRKEKKRSLTATQLHDQKVKRRKTSAIDDGTNNGYDLAPNHVQDDFDLNDIVGSIRREKKKSLEDDLKVTPTNNKSLSVSSSTTLAAPQMTTKPVTVVVNETIKIGNTLINCHIPASEEEEKTMMKRLNINNKTGKSSSQQGRGKSERSIEGRKEGESMRAFEKRLKQETRSILLKSTTKLLSNDEKRKRKKEFLNNKKLKKSRNTDQYLSQSVHSNDDFRSSKTSSEIISNEISRVTFLNQVERPPTFPMLPKGAEEKSSGKSIRTTSSQIRGASKEEDPEIVKLRDKMRMQYKAMKQKRREE